MPKHALHFYANKCVGKSRYREKFSGFSSFFLNRALD